jgi:hypothetical protein
VIDSADRREYLVPIMSGETAITRSGAPAEAPSLLIMAAGIGSRYGGLKQVDQLGPDGEVLLDYTAFDAYRAGFGKIIMVIRGDMHEMFAKRIGDRIARKIPVVYAFQDLADLPTGFSVPEGRVKPWGTAHAVIAARRSIDGPFGVMNADDFYGRGAFHALADALRTHKKSGRRVSCCNISYDVGKTLSENGHVSRGICRMDKDGYLSEIVERGKVKAFPDGVKYALDDGETWVPVRPGSVASMNVWGFPAEIIPMLEERFRLFLESHGREKESECFLPREIGALVKEDKARVKILRSDESWHGITYQADKPEVRQMIDRTVEAGEYPRRLWE